MPPRPSHARPVPKIVQQAADSSREMAPDSRSAVRPATPLPGGPPAASLPARSHKSPPPASGSDARAVVQTAPSAPRWDWYSAPAFCRSGSPGSSRLPRSASQIALPATAPPEPIDRGDTNRPRSAAHCRYADPLPGFAGIPPAPRASCPSAIAFPLFRHRRGISARLGLSGMKEKSARSGRCCAVLHIDRHALILGFAHSSSNAHRQSSNYESHGPEQIWDGRVLARSNLFTSNQAPNYAVSSRGSVILSVAGKAKRSPAKSKDPYFPTTQEHSRSASTSGIRIRSMSDASISSPINESGLRHQLTAGQMTMVAVGGSIGTGLLLGTASAISLAGPAVILSFVLAAFISWTVALALGELASTHPAAGSFGVYARPLPQSLGRLHLPRRLLAGHRRLHRSRDGGLRHLHAALVPERSRAWSGSQSSPPSCSPPTC